MSVLTDFDKLRKYISDPAGKKLMSEVRQRLKNDIEFSDKLYYFFTGALDGCDVEELAKEYKLK